jgi:hypothetical protein
VDDVFDKDRDEALDSCRFELLRGFLTPAHDLGGALVVGAAFVAGQPLCDVGDGSRSGRSFPAGGTVVGAFRYRRQCLSGSLVTGVGGDDAQREVMAVMPDHDDAGRFVTGEAQQLDRVAGDVNLWRRVGPAVAAIAHGNDCPSRSDNNDSSAGSSAGNWVEGATRPRQYARTQAGWV